VEQSHINVFMPQGAIQGGEKVADLCVLSGAELIIPTDPHPKAVPTIIGKNDLFDPIG
jgi:hypothetical protein